MSDERPNRLRAAAEEAMAAGLARSVSIVEQSGMVVVSKAEWKAVQGEVAVLRARSVADAPDPAPSPSIPDPSDKREMAVERLVDLADRAACGLLQRQLPVDDALANDLTDAIEAVRAARPTSLPEAPEPDGPLTDGWRWSTNREHGILTFDGSPIYPSALGVPSDAYLALVHRIEATLATPSVPPVAVDPEAGAPDNDDPARWADEDERWAPLVELGRLVRADCHHGANTYCNHRVREYLGLLAERGYLCAPAAASGGDGEGTGNDG